MLIPDYLVRSHLSIRVPEVYAWSCDPTNPVGAEYIIMEKIRGIALAERWGTMKALERYKVIDGIVKMETELESLKLPAYGSLFLRDSLPSDYSRHTLPSNLDPTGEFCVGPSCSQAVYHKSCSKSEVGPCESCGFTSYV